MAVALAACAAIGYAMFRWVEKPLTEQMRGLVPQYHHEPQRNVIETLYLTANVDRHPKEGKNDPN